MNGDKEKEQIKKAGQICGSLLSQEDTDRVLGWRSADTCAVSATLMGVNPFDQEGVEEYKQSMFAALGK